MNDRRRALLLLRYPVGRGALALPPFSTVLAHRTVVNSVDLDMFISFLSSFDGDARLCNFLDSTRALPSTHSGVKNKNQAVIKMIIKATRFPTPQSGIGLVVRQNQSGPEDPSQLSGHQQLADILTKGTFALVFSDNDFRTVLSDGRCMRLRCLRCRCGAAVSQSCLREPMGVPNPNGDDRMQF